MEKRLFRPSGKVSRGELACEEGVKAKKCLGALRYLWRSSSEGAHDEKLRDMKAYLEDSPLQGRPRPKPGPPEEAAESQMDRQVEDEDEAGSDEAASDPPSDEAASDPPSDEAASDPPSDDDADAATLVMGETSEVGDVEVCDAEGGECGESEEDCEEDPVVEEKAVAPPLKSWENDGKSLPPAARRHLIVNPPLEDVLACGQGSGWLGRMYAEQHADSSVVGEAVFVQMIRDIEENLVGLGLAGRLEG